MADNYNDGTGTFVFEGERRLSPVSQVLMANIHQYEDGTGFFLEEGAYVSPVNVTADLIDHALTLVSDDTPKKKKLRRQLEKVRGDHHNHDACEQLPDLLRKAGIKVNDTLECALRNESSHPIDYAMAVVDDDESSLAQVSWEEAYTCSKMRPGEFGGGGVFYSRLVDHSQFSGATVQFAQNLHNAICDGNHDEVLSLVARQLANVLNAIRNPDLREQAANELLKGEAMRTVEDGIVNQEG
jgi:hypothetical protein